MQKLYEETYIDNAAEAIKAKTGKTEGIYTKDFANEIESIETGVPNLKMWRSTLAADTETTAILVTDPWIAEHYADESLVVLVVPLFTAQGSNRNYGGGFCANRAILRTEKGELMGAAVTNSGSSQEVRAEPALQKLCETTAVYRIAAMKTGRIAVVGYGGYTIKAGEYLVIAHLA